MKMSDELKWKLQLFADDPEDNPEGEGSGDDSENNDDKTEKNGEKKYSDAEVDEIVGKKFAKWKAQHEADLKNAKAEAEKLAKMNADQKKDYEIEKIKAENEKLKSEAAKIELGKEATKILKESDIDATQSMLDFVVGADAEATKANIDKFVGIIDAQLKAAEAERATGKTPKTYGGSREEKSEILKRIEKYK